MSSGIIFRQHIELNKNRVSVWRFDNDKIHLEVEDAGVVMHFVLRVSCADAMKIGAALITAAHAAGAVESEVEDEVPA